MSYDKVTTERQGEIIRGIGVPKPSTQPTVDDFAEAFLRKIQSAGVALPIAR
jgi:hypothetical protein